jgi:hypothetical protein
MPGALIHSNETLPVNTHLVDYIISQVVVVRCLKLQSFA